MRDSRNEVILRIQKTKNSFLKRKSRNQVPENRMETHRKTL